MLAVPISLLVFRLRGGYFAIATWVVADTCRLLVSRSETLGGGTGAGVRGSHGATRRARAYTYWASLAVAVLALAAAYLVLRGRLGLVLTAVRDNEVGRPERGRAGVKRAKRIVYLVAGAGCGAAGALLAVSQRFVQPGRCSACSGPRR